MKKYIPYSIVLIIYSSFFLYVFVNIIPSPVFSSNLNPKSKHFIRLIFMESFGFFTKDPKSKQYHIYKIDDNNNPNEITLRNSDGFNNYGFSRINRKKLIDIAKIEKKVLKKWNESTKKDLSTSSIDYHFECFDTEKLNITHISKGKYLIIKEKPTLWEWRNYSQKNKKIEYVYFCLQ